MRVRDRALPQANNAAETRPRVAGLTKQLPSDEQLGQAGQQSQYSDRLLYAERFAVTLTAQP